MRQDVPVSHGKIVGSCGHLVMQCRCIEGHANVTRLSTPCHDCAAAPAATPDPIEKVKLTLAVGDNVGAKDGARVLTLAEVRALVAAYDAKVTEWERVAMDLRRELWQLKDNPTAEQAAAVAAHVRP